MIGITADEMRARADEVHDARAKDKAAAKAQADAAAVQNALQVIRDGVQKRAAEGLRNALFGTRPLSTEALRSVIGHLRAGGFEVETLGFHGQPQTLDATDEPAPDGDDMAAIFATVFKGIGVCQIRVSWSSKESAP